VNKEKTTKRRLLIKTLAAAILGAASCSHPAPGTKNSKERTNKARNQVNSAVSFSSTKEDKMEKPIKYVEVKVTSVKGTCSLGHKPGDIAKVTENGVEGKICLHALYSLLPAAFAMLYEARFPWLKENPDKKTHACPDAANPVVFEITRIRE
jgi:uncharacterized repeat protein (TIGR04076 family)